MVLHVPKRGCRCLPGYHGEPLALGGSCEEIDCSGNVNVSDPTSYDKVTGECLLCINDADGQYCEKCKAGMYGDAVLEKNCTCKTSNNSTYFKSIPIQCTMYM